jgi:hypothetical protein
MAAPSFSTRRHKAAPRTRKLYTVAEANRALPLVRRIVRDIVATHRQAAETQARLESAANVRQAMAVQGELEATVDRLQDYVGELTALGCQLKDYDVGLIDFPSRSDGREIWLCWRLGEERVEYWHELHAGFSGRQPVTSLAPQI